MPLAKFKKKQKLLRRAEFTETMDRGQKIVTPYVVLLGRASQKGNSRIGFIVSKKVGGAVVRNLVKRRLRDIYRNVPPSAQALDIVAIARVGADRCDFDALKHAFEAGLGQLQARLARRHSVAVGVEQGENAKVGSPMSPRILSPVTPSERKEKNGSPG